MIWWSGDMVGWLECGNMVSGWNVEMFFLFSKCYNGESIFFAHLVKWWNNFIVYWWYCEIVQWWYGFFGDTFPSMGKYWNCEKLKCNLRIGVNCFVGVNFISRDVVLGDSFLWRNVVFSGNYPRGHVPWNCPRSFCAPIQHLTTLDTLLECNESR